MSTPDKPASRPARAPRQAGRPSPRPKPATAAPAGQPADAAKEVAGTERIAKALARAGVCSRRDAERLIAEGEVTLNGQLLTSPAVNVGPRDRITVWGRPVDQPDALRVWRYHKPVGLMTSHKDPMGRPTVFDHLPEGLPRVISVGRLDLNSEGLLLLTNDGALARALELPSSGWLRRYRVRAFGRTTQEDLLVLRDGITVDGVAYGPVEALLERSESANVWLTVSLREGRNREVRRVLEAIGLQVNRLIRTSYGPFQLGSLEAGHVEEVPSSALPEMLGRLMPSGPVRGVRPPPAEPKPVRGQRREEGRDCARPTGRGGPGARSPVAPGADNPAARPAVAGKPASQRGKRRMDPWEEESAIKAELDRRRQRPGKGANKDPGKSPGRGPSKDPVKGVARPGDGKPVGRFAGPGSRAAAGEPAASGYASAPGTGRGPARGANGKGGNMARPGPKRPHSSTKPTNRRP
jgi:23S rRNA pseudouridine2605 synthase